MASAMVLALSTTITGPISVMESGKMTFSMGQGPCFTLMAVFFILDFSILGTRKVTAGYSTKMAI
jgi:hypothetical protein